MSIVTKPLLCAALLVAAIPTAMAKDAKVLDINGKHVRKQEVHHSMIGYRDTLIFYTFPDQKAVLKVRIDNKNKKFTVSGTVYIFADNVTEAGLKKWLNNQHSDGLFVDPARPISTHKVPASACTTKSQKFINHEKVGMGEFDNYAVTFRIGDVVEKGVYQLKGFSAETKAHIKTAPAKRK